MMRSMSQRHDLSNIYIYSKYTIYNSENKIWICKSNLIEVIWTMGKFPLLESKLVSSYWKVSWETNLTTTTVTISIYNSQRAVASRSFLKPGHLQAVLQKSWPDLSQRLQGQNVDVVYSASRNPVRRSLLYSTLSLSKTTYEESLR